VLDQGRLVFSGPIDMAIATYKELDLPTDRSFASPEALFQQRVADLHLIQSALDAYFDDHGLYPSTDDRWTSFVHEQSDVWIPDLVPEYLDSVPTDPLSTWDYSDPQYIYRSNGEGFKLLVRRSNDHHLLTPSARLYADPRSTAGDVCWAYGVWTEDYRDV
jgi:hypothetical protein